MTENVAAARSLLALGEIQNKLMGNFAWFTTKTLIGLPSSAGERSDDVRMGQR
jgi:hypothetical protein